MNECEPTTYSDEHTQTEENYHRHWPHIKMLLNEQTPLL